MPGRLIAAGPGRPAGKSSSPFPVAGTQKVETSVAGCGASADVMAAPGEVPVSVIERQAASPKQPAAVWSGQKRPEGFDRAVVPVVTGLSCAEITPTSVLPSLPPGWQSFDSPCEFVVVHESRMRAPRSHVPVPGLPERRSPSSADTAAWDWT